MLFVVYLNYQLLSLYDFLRVTLYLNIVYNKFNKHINNNMIKKYMI